MNERHESSIGTARTTFHLQDSQFAARFLNKNFAAVPVDSAIGARTGESCRRESYTWRVKHHVYTDSSRGGIYGYIRMFAGSRRRGVCTLTRDEPIRDLHPGMKSGLAKNVVHVIADSPSRHEQLFRDLPIGVPT